MADQQIKVEHAQQEGALVSLRQGSVEAVWAFQKLASQHYVRPLGVELAPALTPTPELYLALMLRLTGSQRSLVPILLALRGVEPRIPDEEQSR